MPRGQFFDGQIILIRPLIYLEERQLGQLARALGFSLDEGGCPFSHSGKRAWVKEWLRQAGADYRQIRTTLWRAARRLGGL